MTVLSRPGVDCIHTPYIAVIIAHNNNILQNRFIQNFYLSGRLKTSYITIDCISSPSIPSVRAIHDYVTYAKAIQQPFTATLLSTVTLMT